MSDTKLRAHTARTLAYYHPFWLKLGLEVVLGRPQRLKAGKTVQQLQSIVRTELFKETPGHGKAKQLDPSYWVTFSWMAYYSFCKKAFCKTDKRRTVQIMLIASNCP